MSFRKASHITDAIIALNHEGILLLRQSKAADALSCFTEALSAVRQLLMDQFDGTLRTTPQNDTKNSQSLITSIPLLESCSRFEPLLEASSEGESFAFYNRAFSIETRWSPHIGTTSLTSILLYNSGLAHHIMAMQGIYNPTSKLEEALRCYKYALTIFRTAVPSSAKEGLYLLTLALLNNMGHIFPYFSCLDEAASCRDRLDELLEELVPNTMSDEDVDFFYFEKMYREQGYMYTAAPAA